MAYDHDLAHRIREQLADHDIAEKQMFGGIAFLLGGNMCVGVSGNEMMVRVGADGAGDALARPHTRPFDMTGRPMKGWIMVAPEGLDTKRQLASWIQRGVAFAGSLPPKR
jgi:TfoX/Sxy family transcriptional regulator of competence genes